MECIRFEELYSIPSSNGVSRPSAVRGQGYKMINMGELFANDIISDMPMERVQLSQKEKEKFLVKENDLLFARQSLVAEGAGKCSIVKQLSEETTFESHLIRVRLNEKICNPWYYYYLFQLPYNPVKTIVNQCAQAGIRSKELLKIKVPLPNMETQNKIADILSTYDELIENNNKRIALLEQMAENLYKEWFVRFRFPNYENAEFEDGIPVGWEYKKINEMFDTSSGGTPSRSNPEYYDGGTIGWVKTGELLDSLIIDTEEHITSAGLQNSAAKLIPVGALLCSMYAGVGKLGITTKEITCSQATCVFMPKSYVSNIFMFHFLKLNKKYLENISFGAAQQNISQVIINKIKFLVPTKEPVLEYDKRVESIYKQIYTIMLKNKNLIKQRDLLLPRLMSGKLEVGKTTENTHKAKVISFEQFVTNMGMAARAKSIFDSDLKAMYEAYIDDDATE